MLHHALTCAVHAQVASKNVHGIEAAVAAMTTHPTSASVQENGAWLLGILGGHDVWRGWGTRYAAHVGHLPMVTHWMTKARAFEAIGQAMLLHPGERLVQSACCQALRMLCTYSPYNKAAVVHTGALESVLVALEMHPDDQEQQSFGMWALVALLTNMPVCSSPVDCKVTSWVSPLGVPSADFSTVSFVLHHRIHYRQHNHHCHCGILATSPDAGIDCPLPTPTGLGRA